MQESRISLSMNPAATKSKMKSAALFKSPFKKGKQRTPKTLPTSKNLRVNNKGPCHSQKASVSNVRYANPKVEVESKIKCSVKTKPTHGDKKRPLKKNKESAPSSQQSRRKFRKLLPVSFKMSPTVNGLYLQDLVADDVQDPSPVHNKRNMQLTSDKHENRNTASKSSTDKSPESTSGNTEVISNKQENQNNLENNLSDKLVNSTSRNVKQTNDKHDNHNATFKNSADEPPETTSGNIQLTSDKHGNQNSVSNNLADNVLESISRNMQLTDDRHENQKAVSSNPLVESPEGTAGKMKLDNNGKQGNQNTVSKNSPDKLTETSLASKQRISDKYQFNDSDFLSSPDVQSKYDSKNVMVSCDEHHVQGSFQENFPDDSMETTSKNNSAVCSKVPIATDFMKSTVAASKSAKSEKKFEDKDENLSFASGSPQHKQEIENMKVTLTKRNLLSLKKKKPQVDTCITESAKSQFTSDRTHSVTINGNAKQMFVEEDSLSDGSDENYQQSLIAFKKKIEEIHQGKQSASKNDRTYSKEISENSKGLLELQKETTNKLHQLTSSSQVSSMSTLPQKKCENFKDPKSKGLARTLGFAYIKSKIKRDLDDFEISLNFKKIKHCLKK